MYEYNTQHNIILLIYHLDVFSNIHNSVEKLVFACQKLIIDMMDIFCVKNL